MALATEHTFSTAFRGQLCKITGFIEPADRSVGIMADSFYANSVFLPDNTEVPFDTITEEEFVKLEAAYWELVSAEENEQVQNQGWEDACYEGEEP